MSKTCAILLIAAVGVLTTPAQNVSRIKEKARGFGGQMTERHNGAETGAPPPGPPPKTGTTTAAATQPATPAVAAAPAKPGTQQQAATKLKADIAAARAKGEVSPEAKKQFVQDLQLAVLGHSQPSAATLTLFTEQFLPAVAAKNVAPTSDAKLVQNIVVSLNCTGLSPTRMTEITGEIETALTKAGATADAAARVGQQLSAIIAEVQTGAAK
jgi:hypothetical protein